MPKPQPFLHRALRIPGDRPPTRFAPRLSRFSAPDGTNYRPRWYQLSTMQCCSVAIIRQAMWILGDVAYLQRLSSSKAETSTLSHCKHLSFPLRRLSSCTRAVIAVNRRRNGANKRGVCLFSTRGSNPPRVWLNRHDKGGVSFMKKLALATAAVLALLSIAGCAQVGKGKAPPPVVTKG